MLHLRKWPIVSAQVTTVQEDIDPSQKPFKDLIDVDLLGEAAELEATHVLVGIDWGAVGTITCEDENHDSEEATKVKGALEAEVKKVKGLLDVGGSASTDFTDKSTGRKFTYYSKCDVFDKQGDLPTSFEGAVEQARKLPATLAGYNKGKGVPITFRLMPIKRLLKRLKVKSSEDIVFQALREDLVEKCVQVVDAATEQKQKLYDLKTELNANKDCIPDEVLTEVNQMYKTLSVGEKGFREDLQKVLKQARSSEVDVAEVEALVAKYEKEQVGGAVLQKYNTWREKIRKVWEIESCGISYMGRCGNLVYELAQEITYIVFVLNASNDCSE